ncbi:putative 4-mercaptohistidine N1-methyltransferase [Verrucomicrobiales bacterium]|nr:putative 4-mercaptohistidine N1-methyltransferase [Verrucomicrobiales bacterium]MDA7614519.1 putative 4-mercaptohistidine N1-methyltransferase [Verrucomicrobiales bacterium]
MNNPYETPGLISQYLLFHYGKPDEILPYDEAPHSALDFAVRAVKEMVDFDLLPARSRALDLGCAVGRSSFTLSEKCHEVIGIDFSHAFVEAAQALAAEGQLPYDRIDEGAMTTRLVAHLPEGAHPQRVQFIQGDAMNVPTEVGQFDMALLANLICRLPEPTRCLERLPDLIRSGGQLVITSPYTWLDEFTPRDRWLGGYVDGDRPVVTIEVLEESLRPYFKLERRQNLPMLIRETARKFQWTMAEGSLWKRL